MFTIQAELIAWLISISTMYACDVAYRLVIQIIIAMRQTSYFIRKPF